MKKSIALAAVLALAACNQPANDTASDAAASATPATEPGAVDPSEAGFEAVAPGEYDIVHPNGSIDHLTVHPGMTWSMVSADNEPSGGTIFEQAGKTCFVTEGVSGHRCFSSDKPGPDGSMKVTGDDGETAIVRPASSASDDAKA